MHRCFGIGILAAAAIAVGCSAGAGPSPDAALPPLAQARSAHTLVARLALLIPPRRRERHARYISPATQSLAIVVQPVPSAGPASSPLPVQTFNVAPPACSAAGGSPNRGYACRFDVEVMPGSDAFSLTAYDAKNAKGSVLSAYASAVPVPIPAGGALHFTLEGAVSSVVMYAGTPSTQQGAVPIGVATSLPVFVQPLDADGNAIFAQQSGSGYVPYLAPFRIRVTPASAGVTLKNARGSGASVTIAGPADLAIVAAYDGSVHFQGSAISDTSFALTPSFASQSGAGARTGTPAPNSAEIDLASNALGYVVATPNPAPSGPVLAEGLQYAAKSGTFYYAVNGGTTSQIGTFRPGGSKLRDAAALGVDFPAGGLYADSYGGAWFSSGTNVYCFKQFASRVADETLSPVPPSSGSAFVEGMTQDASGRMWFTSGVFGDGTELGGFADAPVTGACQTGTLETASYQYNGYGEGPTLYAVGPQSTGSGIWATPSVQSVAYPANDVFEGFARASNGTVYALTSNQAAQRNRLETVSPSGALASVAALPYAMVQGWKFALTPSLRLAYDDAYNGVEVFDKPSGKIVAAPMPIAPHLDRTVSASCNGVAFDATEVPWTLCTRSDRAAAVYRLLLTPTWSVFPGASLGVDVASYCQINYPLGIGEAFPGDSAPFTMTSSNPTIAKPNGTIAGNSHLLSVEVGDGTGKAVVTVTDKKGRRAAVTFDVTDDANAIGCD